MYTRTIRRFRTDGAGASPVIGEVLMVAIVVIIATIIWILVSGMLIDPNEPMITVSVDKPRVNTRGTVHDATIGVVRVSPEDQAVPWSQVHVLVKAYNGSVLNQSTAPTTDTNATYHDYVEIWYVEVTPGDMMMSGSDSIKITGMSKDYEGATVILIANGERIAEVDLPGIFG